MFKNHRRLLAHVLLACLTLQPFTTAAAFSWQPPTQQPTTAPELVLPADFQASETLQSPWKKDFAALEFLSQFPISTNKELLEVLRNKMPVCLEAMDKQYTAQEVKEKRSWVKLFNNLQFVNEEGKKSSMIGLGRTITEAGRISFLNIIGQENTDVGVAKKRQEFIRFLIENPDQLRQIQEQLHIIKKFENEPAKDIIEKDHFAGMSAEMRTEIAKIQNQQKMAQKILRPYLAVYFNGLLAIAGEQKTLDTAPWKEALRRINPDVAEPVNRMLPDIYLTPVMQHALLTFAILFYPQLAEAIKKIEPLVNVGTSTLHGANYLAAACVTALTTLSLVNSKLAAKLSLMILGTGAHIIAPAAELHWKAGMFLKNLIQLPLHQNISRLKPTGFVANKAVNLLFTHNDAISGAYAALTDTPVTIRGHRVPLKYIVLPFALPFIALWLIGIKKGFMNKKAQFAHLNGIANVVKASKQLKDILKQIPTTASDYASMLDSTSSVYKKIEGKVTSSSQYKVDAEYGVMDLFIHNHAKDCFIAENVRSTLEDFSKVTQFYGEIDAYASLAQLMIDHLTIKASHGEAIKCCFVEFVNNPVESMLVAEDMWHPIIPTTHVRTNSIALGDSVDHPRNGIITGPNAAGKSVSMKALLINIVLGQSFGIACAKSFKFTPFKKIIARLSSNDDTANDQSKFMLEAADVVAFLKELKSLKPGEKAFVVTDELFSRTEVNPAILLSFELCARVSRFPNVCYLLATHYKDLTQLKEITGQQFENFKVSAFVVDNKVHYPFKLTKGVGDVNVAFDIFLDQMEKQGVRDEDLESIISNARKRQHLLENNSGAIIA